MKIRPIWVALTLLFALFNTQTAMAQGRDQAYRINPSDTLEVYVWGEERLQRSVKVLPDGTIGFPLVGQVQAAGFLPAELEALITQRLADQYREEVPNVTVSITGTDGYAFSVVGKVGNTGTFAPGRYVNVIEALSLAGGPSEFADLDNIILLRKSGDRLEPVRVRLSKIMKSNISAEDLADRNIPLMQAGDTMVVQ